MAQDNNAKLEHLKQKYHSVLNRSILGAGMSERSQNADTSIGPPKLQILVNQRSGPALNVSQRSP